MSGIMESSLILCATSLRYDDFATPVTFTWYDLKLIPDWSICLILPVFASMLYRFLVCGSA